MLRTISIVLLLTVLSCTHHGGLAVEDASILSAVIDAKPARTVTVFDETVAPPMIDDPPHEALLWKDIGSSEIRQLIRRNRGPVSIAMFSLNQVKLIDVKVSRQSEVIQVSLPAYSRDRQSAVVYFAIECGPLCGGGKLVYLELKDGAWHMTREQQLWNS